MKQKKYSESKIKTAQKFLSKDQVDFDALNEQQKEVIIKHVDRRRWLGLVLLCFVLVVVYYSYRAHTDHSAANLMIERISENSASVKLKDNSETITLSEYGKKCFDRGQSVELKNNMAIIMALLAAFYAVDIFWTGRTINAFLPSLKQLSGNDKTPIN